MPPWQGVIEESEYPSLIAYVEELSRRHQFRLQRLGSDTFEDFFPKKLEEPTDLDSIPSEQCDLLLTRE